MGHKKHSKHHQKSKHKKSSTNLWQSVSPVLKLLAFGVVAGLAYLILSGEDQPESNHELETKPEPDESLPNPDEDLEEVIEDYEHETSELTAEYQSESN